jgi:phosphoribosylamine--glycine ligase
VKILVLGSGGREHALVWRLARDADVRGVVCAPGNPGMAALAPCRPVDLAAPDEVLALAAAERVDLTVVGPEAPLERGLADVFRRAGRAIVGPDRQGAALECSKVFAKGFMAEQDIPTARFVVCDGPDRARAVVAGGELGLPVVVKADGLAAGKGVVIAATPADAEAAIDLMMVDRRFGGAGARVVLEECLTGPEVSCFVLCDGDRGLLLGTAQDHKRIWDDDRGPNTGGMGAFAPSPLWTDELADLVQRRIVQPALAGMRAKGVPYRGFLYVSLMLTREGPRVIEFNVRLGDPEAQVVLPLIDGGLAAALSSSAEGDLAGRTLVAGARRYVGVVMASRGYPGSAESGRAIHGLESVADSDDVLVFHAGTARAADGQLVTAGGRVLTVVGAGDTYERAMTTAYRAVDAIHFDGMQFRRDIGRKAAASGSVQV